MFNDKHFKTFLHSICQPEQNRTVKDKNPIQSLKRKKKQYSICLHHLNINLTNRFNLIFGQVGDEVQLMLYTRLPREDDSPDGRRGPRARRAHVVRFEARTAACLRQFLRQHMPAQSACLPSGTLSQLLSGAQPLWRLLLSAVPSLGPELRVLLARVLAEGQVRMRSTTRSLARDLLELPYFANTGQLARDIQDLVRER